MFNSKTQQIEKKKTIKFNELISKMNAIYRYVKSYFLKPLLKQNTRV